MEGCQVQRSFASPETRRCVNCGEQHTGKFDMCSECFIPDVCDLCGEDAIPDEARRCESQCHLCAQCDQEIFEDQEFISACRRRGLQGSDESLLYGVPDRK